MNLPPFFRFLTRLFSRPDDTKRLSFSAEKIFSLTHKTPTSYQGAACYGKYLFQFSDHMGNVGVYDLEKRALLSVIDLKSNPLYHCNNANFGKKGEEEFPLLYVSMENIDAHCALVFRVERKGEEFSLTKVQTIVYPDPRKAGVYYPNCMVDGENGFLYVMGYTQNSYNKSKNNFIKVTRFPLPVINDPIVELSGDGLDSFLLPSVTATQGGLVVDGNIYQTYGFDGSSSFRVIDPEKKCFSACVQLPRHRFTSEPESLVFYNGNFYCADVRGRVFLFRINPV